MNLNNEYQKPPKKVYIILLTILFFFIYDRNIKIYMLHESKNLEFDIFNENELME